MNPLIGWALAAVGLLAGWFGYGWPGVALAVTAIVFWLVLQFNRSLRVMRNAAAAPIGHVDSAVMLHTRLRPRMQMLQVLTLTKSLGRRAEPESGVYSWADDGGSEVVVTVDDGRISHWVLNRPPEAAE
ncbi:MAG: hypothetical protein ABIV63_02945 [Caldimonas sp.]